MDALVIVNRQARRRSARQGPLRLLALAYALRSGRYRRREKIFALRGKKIEIRTEPVREIDADGEPTGETPAVFHIEQSALPVFVPAPPTGEEA